MRVFASFVHSRTMTDATMGFCIPTVFDQTKCNTKNEQKYTLLQIAVWDPKLKNVDWTMTNLTFNRQNLAWTLNTRERATFESQLLFINAALQSDTMAGHLKRRNYAILWKYDWFDLFLWCLCRQQARIYCRPLAETHSTNSRMRYELQLTAEHT